MQNNIVLITNNDKAALSIQKKILLLRNTDALTVIGYENCFENIKKYRPVLVLYHLKDDEKEAENFLNFLQKLKQTKEFETTSVMMLYEYLDEDVLSSAFEKGLTDFMPVDSSDSEFTIRTIWCLQKREFLSETEEKKIYFHN